MTKDTNNLYKQIAEQRKMFWRVLRMSHSPNFDIDIKRDTNVIRHNIKQLRKKVRNIEKI